VNAERFSKQVLLPQLTSLLEFDDVNDSTVLNAAPHSSVKAQ